MPPIPEGVGLEMYGLDRNVKAKLAALDKSQTTIVFKLDGTTLTANAVFPA